jgi:serine/threonine-protein kinase RsbW
MVSVPARPDYIHVLRAVASSAASRLDLPFDAVEETRMAVDEASTLLLQLRTPASRFRLSIETGDEGLRVGIATDAVVDDWPPPGVEDAWPWRVISGLSDDSRFEMSARGPGISFLKRRHGDLP